MFKKLITNLPFNPSLIHQVNFYAKRIRQEEVIRRMGFGFMALAMAIQTFAVIAPPEKSLAYSSDYIINGLRTRDDILRAWDGRTSDRNVANIYGKFGITRSDIEALPASPNVTLNSCYADYWTIGRTSLSAVSKSSRIKQQYKNSEVAVNYGGGNVYLRQLKAWDIVNNCNTYRAFEGWKNGKQFWILVDCGNFTQVGQPPILKDPALDLRKTIEGGPRNLKPGDSFTFRFEYRNKIPESRPVEQAVIEDDFDLKNFDITGFEYPLSPGAKISQYLWPSGSTGLRSFMSLPLGRVNYTDGNYRVAARVTVKLKSNLENGTKVCNAAKLRSLQNNVPEAWSGGHTLCITVIKPVDVCPNIPGDQSVIPSGRIKDRSGDCVTPSAPDVCPNLSGNQASPPSGYIIDQNGNCVVPPKPCPIDSSINENDPRCEAPKLSCSDMKIIDVNRTTKTFRIKTTAESSNEYMTSITSYVYDFGDNSPKQTVRSSSYTNEISHVYQDGKYDASVVINYNAGRGNAQTSQSVECSVAVDSRPDEPLTQEKTARNVTQNLDEQKTLATKVKASDVIEYSLITSNSFDYERRNINTSDYIGDLLDYADLDMAYLQSQGGEYDEETKTISWAAESVKANGEMVKRFRIKIKDPVPSTNQPSAMTTAFNCQISNKFGDQVDLEVDCPLPKSAEYITTTLPKTGPGTSLVIGFTATTVIAYFFARSRLLTKELELIRTDFAQTGGV